MTPELEQTLRVLNPDLDEVNFILLLARADAFISREGPQTGEFVRMLDGTLRRFTDDWDTDIQTTFIRGDQNFFLEIMSADYSGSHDSPILKTKLVDTLDVENGFFWFFKNNSRQPGDRLSVTFPCRVWKQQR